MENKNLFHSFRYVVGNDFIYKDKVGVKVFFIFNDEVVITKSLFIKKLANKNEAYYLSEAKKIIDQMIRDGSLEKEGKRKARRKKILPILLPLVSACALAGAGVGTYYYMISHQPIAQEEVVVDVPEINGLVVENQKAYVGVDYDTKISVNTVLTTNVLPNELVKVVSGNRELLKTEYTYTVSEDKLSATLHIPGQYIEGDIKIELVLVEPVPPGPVAWYLDNDYLNSLTPEDITKENPDGTIGVVQTLKVNGLDHQVRLIGVGEDEDADGNTIHTTWEFVNLISDGNGYSLATQWNDTNDTSTAHYKYTESTIRHALNGENADNVLWAQKEATTWSSDYKCSVLDMLNEGNSGFGDAIKAPSKWININDGGWEEETINDKLFLLTPKEMGRTEGTGEETKTDTYSYYDGATDGKRIKKQVEGTEKYNPDLSSVKQIPEGEGQTYQGQVINYAGYNEESDATGGGYLWFRSPCTTRGLNAWRVFYDGKMVDNATVYRFALAIAPAFCI